ncbi:MAG: hypothetical protein JWO56_1988 [Acidobacteria bacterium]|nr:hypothetical protein [Acidobacteriota bacterium]
MPNPDGTMTGDEISQALFYLFRKHGAAGLSPEDALAAASADFRAIQVAERQAKLALVERFMRGATNH